MARTKEQIADDLAEAENAAYVYAVYMAREYVAPKLARFIDWENEETWDDLETQYKRVQAARQRYVEAKAARAAFNA